MATMTKDSTKERLLDAAAATLAERGFAGTTARSIATTGALNQALIFYHWGSVDQLLLAALDRSSDARMARYREVLGACETAKSVLAALPALYEEDVESGHVDLLCELVAGGVTRRDLGREVAGRVTPWSDLVEETLQAVLPRTVARRLPMEAAAAATVAFFLGTELLGRLHGDKGLAQKSFHAAGRLGAVTSLLPRPRPTGRMARSEASA